MSRYAFPGVVSLLKSPDLEVVHAALAFTEMVLRMNGEKGRRLFEECGGMDFIESLEYHDNETIRRETNELLEKYIWQEDT